MFLTITQINKVLQPKLQNRLLAVPENFHLSLLSLFIAILVEYLEIHNLHEPNGLSLSFSMVGGIIKGC